MTDDDNLWTFTSTIYTPSGLTISATVTVPESREDFMENGEVAQMMATSGANFVRRAEAAQAAERNRVDFS